MLDVSQVKQLIVDMKLDTSAKIHRTFSLTLGQVKTLQKTAESLNLTLSEAVAVAVKLLASNLECVEASKPEEPAEKE